MPPSPGSAAHRSRSAEQMARLLLSNGFRYDSWEAKETRKSIQAHGGTCVTLQLSFRDLAKQSISEAALEALNLVLFEPSKGMFYGSSYQLEKRDLTRPIVVQAAPTQLVVVEVLVPETRPDQPLEQYRVTRWGTCRVEDLKSGAVSFSLHPGTAQLLQVEKTSWPPECLPDAPSSAALLCDVAVNADPALAQLMSELVPPGVFVSQDFTRRTPQPGSHTFKLVVKTIEIAGSSAESAANLSDPDADWSVAAIAHNGFRPLGNGCEVPLTLASSTERDSSGGSGSLSSSSSRHAAASPKTAATPNVVLLRSDLPLEMNRLPVHAATSLVMAVRRRAPGARAFTVVGFCVLPLCIMPMQDRDIRIENLPALRGPFSCEDARLLMLDSTSPYGRVPIAVTLTVEYHDTGVSASAAVAPGEGGGTASGAAGPAAASAALGAFSPAPEEITKDDVSSGSHSSLAGSERSLNRDAVSKPTQVLSTADAPMPSALPLPTVLPADATAASPTTSPAAVPTSEAAGLPGSVSPQQQSTGDSVGIFKLLCTIMEELHKVRESQEVILRQTSGLSGGDVNAMSPALRDRLNKGLADGAVDVIDLAPRPLAVSWRARKLMQDSVQPILHPLHGTLLDDTAPVVGSLTSSLYGFRVEGITVDNAVHLPADVCLLFSFGPLPYQQVGPLCLTNVEETSTNGSFKVYDAQDRAGFVWCEPVEALQSAVMAKFKGAGNATIYVHVYDALTMFYVATAHLPVAAFRRSIAATCAMVPMDVVLQRDLSMTEQVVPPKVFPVMRQAGQLHLTLFCVGVSAGEGPDLSGGDGAPASRSDVMRLPRELGGAAGARGRVITAKKLRHVDQLSPSEGRARKLNSDGAKEQSSSSSSSSSYRHSLHGGSPNRAASVLPVGTSIGGEQADGSTRHWQRASYVKAQLREQRQQMGSTQLPGVPDAHVQAAQAAAEMEYRLRQLEHERAVVKSRRIAEALLSRLTVEHDVHAIAWRPEVVRTPFTNPFACAMQFFVEVDPACLDVCTVVEGASLYLGPREKTELPLVLRLSMSKASQDAHAAQQQQDIIARVYSEKRELVCCIRVHATVEPPLVDRRYEVFGPAGTEVTKRYLSRTFSSASFPVTSNQAALLQRMRELCTFVATSAEHTSVTTNAVLDPITQTYVTAWEEVTVRTTTPRELGRQRVEYVTLFHDAAMSRVYETWELCVFACESFMTRDISWGQTTALGIPADGTQDLYCSDASVTVERRGPSHVLRLHPRDVGTQRMLLHTLQADTLKKTLLTVPTVYPTPSYSQVIELSLAEAKGPVLRRLTFVHRGEVEEVFQVHHNYKFNLQASPSKFALAPDDSQFVTLQFDMLSLPPGQLEGRWPMWIFINNAEDKTVESYHLEVVLRAHPVLRVPE